MTRSYAWPVSMTVRFHLFPFRTQKLSSLVPKIVGWRRPVKIGRCRLLYKAASGPSLGPGPEFALYAPLAQLVEQLTLNQWVLGSSPRWCTKRKPLRRIPPWGLCFWLHARRTRTGRRHRSAGTNSPADCWLARGRVPGECRGRQSVAGVAILLLHGLTENVGLFFCCNNPEC